MSVNARSGKYGNALQAASANCHKDVVELLLQADVDVNAQGGIYSNTLYATAVKGY